MKLEDITTNDYYKKLTSVMLAAKGKQLTAKSYKYETLFR